MTNSLVVDTNVIINGCTGEGNAIECMMIFVKIYEGKVVLGVDSEGMILDEYKKNLNVHINSPISKMITKFIETEIYNTGERKIKSYIPINEQKVKSLMEMGFHKNDVKFVRVAPLTDLKIIFSSDSRSFLNSEYSSWMKNNLDVETKHPSDFLNFISQIP